MEKTIKTREVIKDIKTLEKKPVLAGALKDTSIKSRAEVQEQSSGVVGQKPQHRSPNAYAENKAEQGAKDIAIGTSKGARAISEKVVEKGKKEFTERLAKDYTKQHTSTQVAQKTASGARQSTAAKQGVIKAKQATAQSTKLAAKNTIKGSGKTVKTGSKVAVKTSQSAAHGAKAAAKGAQIAARGAAQAAQVTAKTAAVVAKATAKAIVAFVKMAIAAIQSLVAAIAAGGWVAVVIVVIILLVGLVAGSAFGIFFAGGDMGDGNPTLRQVISETNGEYVEKIEQIKRDNPHDELVRSGSQTRWPDVLAIFAVRTTTNPDEPLDVVTMDERRQQLMRNIFWDMNSLETRIEEREFTEIIAMEQDDGTIVEETVTTTRRTLYITQKVKSVDQMATVYGFSSKQKDLLLELLSPAYNSTWQAVLYGIHSGAGDIVEIAATQIGNVGGQPYWSWYGFNSRVEWCACFVSWCANEAGYIESGMVPKFSYCPTGANWFRDAGRWHGRGYVPNPGDIIFFDWEGDGITDHVGIVESSDGSNVYTIEGNSGDMCRRCTYSVNSSVIYGYGVIGI